MQATANLTHKQLSFVDHVMTGRSATVAAQRAGFSPRSARQIAVRLMSKASIRAEIAARQGVDSRRLGLERQDVIAGLLAAAQMARERSEPMAMIAAWKALAAMLGFMAPQRHAVEAAAAPDADIGRYESMSDAQLLALVGDG